MIVDDSHCLFSIVSVLSCRCLAIAGYGFQYVDIGVWPSGVSHRDEMESLTQPADLDPADRLGDGGPTIDRRLHRMDIQLPYSGWDCRYRLAVNESDLPCFSSIAATVPTANMPPPSELASP